MISKKISGSGFWESLSLPVKRDNWLVPFVLLPYYLESGYKGAAAALLPP